MTPPVDVTDKEETRLHLLDIADQLEGEQYARADTSIAALLSSTRRQLADSKRGGAEA